MPYDHNNNNNNNNKNTTATTATTRRRRRNTTRTTTSRVLQATKRSAYNLQQESCKYKFPELPMCECVCVSHAEMLFVVYKKIVLNFDTHWSFHRRVFLTKEVAESKI